MIKAFVSARRRFPDAVLAGVAIGIGGIAFLSVESPIVGSLLFAVGLYVICAHCLQLFTGKAGYLVDHSVSFWDLLWIWCGNLVGTLLTGVYVNITRIGGISARAQALCQIKLNDTWLSLFLLAILCGLLMYAAVDGYSRIKNPLLLFICVSAFILCGFEHSVADMFYFSVSGLLFTWPAMWRILVISAGNLIGCILIPLCKQMVDRNWRASYDF